MVARLILFIAVILGFQLTHAQMPLSIPQAIKASPQWEKTKAFLESMATMRWGIGLSGNAAAGAATGYNLELLNLGTTIVDRTFYCAPAAGVLTDVALGGSISLIKPMGYNLPEDYTGYAVSIGLNLPLKIGSFQYAWGANLSDALDVLERQKKNGEFEPRQIPDEMIRLIKVLGSKDISAQKKAQIQIIACKIGNLLLPGQMPSECSAPVTTQFTTQTAPEVKNYDQEEAQKVNQWIESDYSAMYKALKDLNDKNTFEKVAPNFNKFFKAVTGSITNAGSIAIGVGLGFSLAPVSVSAQWSHYTLVSRDPEIRRKFMENKKPIKKFIGDIIDGEIENMKSVGKNMSQFCPDSRAWMWRDMVRFKNLMAAPIEEKADDFDIAPYFTESSKVKNPTASRKKP